MHTYYMYSHSQVRIRQHKVAIGTVCVVLGKSCNQAKHTTAHVLPGQKMPMASFAQATDAKGNLQPIITNNICV